MAYPKEVSNRASSRCRRHEGRVVPGKEFSVSLAGPSVSKWRGDAHKTARSLGQAIGFSRQETVALLLVLNVKAKGEARTQQGPSALGT